MRVIATATFAAIMLTSCGVSAGGATSSSPALAPCAQLVHDCQATRLPDVTLTAGQTFGAFGPVDGMDLSAIISFDDALRRAGAEDGHPDAKTVQVTLGSANASDLHWGEGTNLYYGVDWAGVCVPMLGPSLSSGGSPPLPTCAGSDWVTVIDAHTGAFIVGGN
ncbi:MAG: hypothetical protein HY240_01445 [Actinobacteria bacterium]|nr:hypothetical protein [Actinomycetota bacterium]